MAQAQLHFDQPGRVASAINRTFGWLTALGIGPSYSFLLQVKGRKSGKTYSTPVNVLVHGAKSYLVGTRGHTQWSRNAKALGSVTLQRGRQANRFRVRVVPDEEKAEILKAYVTRFNWMVSRFFPVRSDSAVSAFNDIASGYPVFELLAESSVNNPAKELLPRS
ncbi:MAG TPA: nitroreductase family deazaflavin-dependent oxidoreductase [Acidobacteriota bacterium]|nr:nitroreductase family deazaflavin-dependent oxidoreductase [Acidobacteriota bacterium]